MANKQDSNLVGLAICEESSLGTLPAAASQHWLQLEPNDFPNFGNEITKVARKTINNRRKVRKGGVTDVDAVGSFGCDLTPSWLMRFMRGFFFTDGDQAGTTDPLNIANRRTVTAVGSSDDFTLSANVVGSLSAGMLVYGDGFTNSENNGVHVVDTVTSGTEFTVDSSLEAETPPAAARLRVIGFQFGIGELVASTSGDYLILTSTSATDLDDLNIHVGDTIFIGGDATATAFDTLGTGFARVVSVAASVLLLQDFTGTAAADAGTGKTIRIFHPHIGLRDEPLATNINRRSYNLERTLGEDDDGEMAEYIVGAVPNEMSMAFPEAGKVEVSFTYQGLDRETIAGTGTVKSSAAGATSYDQEAEEYINTSSDLYVGRVIKTSGQTSLVGYLQKVDISVSNGVTPNKALGVTGAFDFSTGDFTVSGSVNAYFNTVAAMDAIRDNDDVSLQIIAARDNEGFAVAMPLVALGGGQADVTSDQAIMLPMELNAAASTSLGDVTMTVGYFPYLPDAAMPTS